MTVITCPNCGAKNRIDPARAQTERPICGRCKRELPVETLGGSGPVEMTDQTFQDTLSNACDRPVLVDCWAPWCGPCRMLSPIIEQIASESNGKYTVTKLNTDENPQTAARFSISAIPTILIFKNGKLVDQLVGLHPKQAILQHL